jgi:hypothetical protein
MTYDEALELKSKYHDTIRHHDIFFKIYICPYDNEDFTNYILNYVRLGWTDSKAKLYSRNGKFLICGISGMEGGGPHISYDNLLPLLPQNEK